MGSNHLRVFAMAATAAAAATVGASISDGDTNVYKRWSDPATWGGSLPIAGDPITIGPSDNILLDIDTPALGPLVINGKFKFDPARNVSLTASSISGNGAEWRIGSATAPYRQQFQITLTGQMPTVSGNPGGGPLVRGRSFIGLMPTGNNGTTNDNGGINRGIVFTNSKIAWYGAVPAALKASLSQHAMPGDTSITLDVGVTWKQGDKIVIPPTGYPSTARQTEVYTVAAATNGSNVVQLTSPITYKRWGRMQYPTDSGISLTQGPFTLRTTANPTGMKATVDTPTFIDQRAPVENITRNGLVRGGIEDGYGGDVAWRRDGFGVHMMIMGLASDVVVDGIAFDRCGQRGLLGRYPFHWHMLSYDGATGNFLGDIPAGKGVFSRNVVTNSENRGTTIHATCGAQVVGNTYYKTKGHTIFPEDGPEERNTISGNSGYYLRPMTAGFEIKAHDFGATSFIWVSNWYNHITGNVAADIVGAGIQNSPHVLHAWVSVPVFTGTGRASFSARNGGALIGSTGRDSFVEQNHTLTCTNATAPATFSHVGSVSGAYPSKTVGVGFDVPAGQWRYFYDNNTGQNALIINAPSTPFVVGDTITFQTKKLSCTGPSRFANVHPYYREVLDYDNNRVWCATDLGVDVTNLPQDEEGNTTQGKIQSTTDGIPGSDFGNPNQIESLFKRMQIHHCVTGGYKNRISRPHYKSWTQTDNFNIDFFGATDAGGLVSDTLLAARTLNIDINDGTFITDDSGKPKHGLASYHGTLGFNGISAFGYQSNGTFALDRDGGTLTTTSLIQSWDFYLVPVERSMAIAENILLFDSIAMVQSPPTWMNQSYSDVSSEPATQGRPIAAGAVWDRFGTLTGVTGGYLCFNYPSVTYGMQNKTVLSPSWRHSVVTTDHMCGAKAEYRDLPAPNYYDAGRRTSQTFRRYNPQTFTRAVDGGGAPIADWADLGSTASAYRFAAFPVGGAILIFPTAFPTTIPQIYNSCSVHELRARVDGGDAATDFAYYGLHFTNTKTPHVSKSYQHSSWRDDDAERPPNDYVKTTGVSVPFSQVGSPSALVSSAGDTFWHDTTNQIVWSKVIPNPGESYTNDITNSRLFYLVVNDGSQG